MALACATIAIPNRAWTPAVTSTAVPGGRCAPEVTGMLDLRGNWC
jgi:hypothetical protein